MIKERLLMIRESRLCWHLILGVGYVGKSEHLAADYLQPSASLARCTMVELRTDSIKIQLHIACMVVWCS